MNRSIPGIAVRVTTVLAMFALATAADAQRTSAPKAAPKPATQSGADIEGGPFKTGFGPLFHRGFGWS